LFTRAEACGASLLVLALFGCSLRSTHWRRY